MSGRIGCRQSIMTLLLGVILLYISISFTTAVTYTDAGNTTAPEHIGNNMTIYLKRLKGAGCPYTASWLVHLNLLRRIPWSLDNPKLELSSFNLFNRVENKYQLSDPSAFYVHHMSGFEHNVAKNSGFEDAQNKSRILAKAAYAGECMQASKTVQGALGNISSRSTRSHLQPGKARYYLTVIPFYGGKANSQVDSETKTDMAMAVICSCLKYFGRVLIGVANVEDRHRINKAIDSTMSSSNRHLINVVQFEVANPALLPVNLIAWAQHYAKRSNCRSAKQVQLQEQQFFLQQRKTNSSPTDIYIDTSAPKTNNPSFMDKEAMKNLRITAPPPSDLPYACAICTIKSDQQQFVHDTYEHLPPAMFHKKSQHEWPLAYHIRNMIPSAGTPFDICHKHAIAPSKGPDIQVKYVRDQYMFLSDIPDDSNITLSPVLVKRHAAIKYVYFTESDQIVRFDHTDTLNMLAYHLDNTTFFTGRRKEKNKDSDPAQYMEGLDKWSDCGTFGYSLRTGYPHVLTE